MSKRRAIDASSKPYFLLSGTKARRKKERLHNLLALQKAAIRRLAESTMTHIAEDDPTMEQQNLLLVKRQRPISDAVTNPTNPVTNHSQLFHSHRDNKKGRMRSSSKSPRPATS
jgi:hypothetical protein